MNDPISNNGEGTPPAESFLKAAKDAWLTRAGHNAETQQYLEDETWRGVLIGFLLGYGMSLDEAHWSLTFGGFDY